MGLGALGREDVPHGLAARDQGVGDERAMAAPPHGLGAHDRHLLAACERHQPIELGGEHVGLHVVRIGAERGVLPRAVDGVRLLAPEAPEAGEMRVAEAGGVERSRQGVDVEVRMAPRAR